MAPRFEWIRAIFLPAILIVYVHFFFPKAIFNFHERVGVNEDFLSLRGIVGDAGFRVDAGNTLLDRMLVVGKCAFATEGLLFSGKVRVLM